LNGHDAPSLIATIDRRRGDYDGGTCLDENTEWGWDEAQPRRLSFRTEFPRPQWFLLRYRPVDTDRNLTAALPESTTQTNNCASTSMSTAPAKPPPEPRDPAA
jgi:hypothetical protein